MIQCLNIINSRFIESEFKGFPAFKIQFESYIEKTFEVGSFQASHLPLLSFLPLPPTLAL